MNRGMIAGVIGAAVLLGELAAMCAGDVPSLPYLTRLGFHEVENLIEALPPDTLQMEFYRNWVRSSRELWEEDNGRSAAYQLTLMKRKLGRLQGEWSET